MKNYFFALSLAVATLSTLPAFAGSFTVTAESGTTSTIDVATLSLSNELSVRRAIQYDGYYYVLAYDGEDTQSPIILKVNPIGGEFTSISTTGIKTDGYSDDGYSKSMNWVISDIGITDDGYLVAINSVVIGGSDREAYVTGDFYMYIWANGTESTPTATKLIDAYNSSTTVPLAGANKSNLIGNTFAINGSLEDGFYFYTTSHPMSDSSNYWDNGDDWQTRFICYYVTVSDGTATISKSYRTNDADTNEIEITDSYDENYDWPWLGETDMVTYLTGSQSSAPVLVFDGIGNATMSVELKPDTETTTAQTGSGNGNMDFTILSSTAISDYDTGDPSFIYVNPNVYMITPTLISSTGSYVSTEESGESSDESDGTETTFTQTVTEPTISGTASRRIYAYGLSATESDDGSYTLTFSTNIAPSDFAINLYAADADGEYSSDPTRTIYKGDLTYTESDNTYSVTITEAIAGSMNKFRWSVTAYAAAIESFAQVSASASSTDSDFDSDLVFYAPYGVAVDNSPESPYFGTVYVGNAGAGSSTYNSRSAGIYRFDPTDESKDASDSDEEQASGYFSDTFAYTKTNATYGLKALDVASNGRLFATLYSVSASGIYYVSPDMSSATVLSSLSTAYNVGISLRETSSDTELFLIDFTGTYNTVANYTLGSDNTLTLGSVSATMKYGNRYSNIATTATGYFVNQGSGDSSSKYSGLFYYDDADTKATTALATSSSSDRGAVAVYEEENLVAYSLGGNLYLSYYTYSDDGTSVTLSNFDSENEYYTATALGSYACAFDFDYAGNLYAVSSDGECLAVYAIPTSDNSCTTFATAGADETGYILDFTEEGAEYVYECTYGVSVYNVTNGLESATKISEAEVVITDDTDPSKSYISASAEANNLGSAMTVYLLVNDQVFVTTSDSEAASTVSLPATRRIFAYDLRATLDDTEKQYDYTDSQTGKTVTKKSNGGEFYTLSFKTNTIADYVTVNLYKVTQGTTTDESGNSVDDGTVQSVATEPTMTYTFTYPVSTSFVLEAHALSEGATSDIEDEESDEESVASEEGSSSDSSDVNYGYLYELGGDDYTWEVIAHAGPVMTFTESSETSEELNIYAPYGIVCNTNPETDEFGDVYVANIQVGTTTDHARITDNGIYIFEADDTPRYLRTDENFSYYNITNSETVSGSAVLGYKGNITWPGNYSGGTYNSGWSQRLCLSSDGKRLFMNDRSYKKETTINGESVTFNSTGVYEIDPTTFATKYAADEDVEMSNIFGGLESETVTETADDSSTTTYAKLFIDTDGDGELDDDETVVAGSMVAIGIRGDEDNVQLYGIDKSTTGFTTTVTNSESDNSKTTSTVRLLGIRRYDISSNTYNSTSPWNTAASYSFDLSDKTDSDADGYDDTDNTLLAGIVNGNANMVIVDGGIWAAQYRYANRVTSYTPSLLYYSEGDEGNLTPVYESSEFDNSDKFLTLTLSAYVDGSTTQTYNYSGYSSRNGALAVNESENLIAQTFNYGVRLMYYSFDSSGSDNEVATASETETTSAVPTITSCELYETPAQEGNQSGSNSYAFDYAGNLYATSSSAEYVSVYGIPMPVDEETGETEENQKTITPNSSNKYIGFSVSDLASGVIDNLADANQAATAKVYPNPATSDVTIECGDEITSIVIYNLGTGAQVINLAGNGSTTATVDVDGLASGLYVVKINGSIAKKLLVK